MLTFNMKKAFWPSSKYPDVERHIAAHRALEQTVMNKRRRFEQQPADRENKALACYLRDWWISHINDIDPAYSNYLNCPTTLRSGV